MFERIEAFSGLLCALFALSVIVNCFFIWGGSKLVGIKKLKFRKATIVATVLSFILYSVVFLFLFFPLINIILGFLLGIFMTFFGIKTLLKLPVKKAFFVWIFNVLAQVIAVFFGALLFIGGISDLLKIF